MPRGVYDRSAKKDETATKTTAPKAPKVTAPKAAPAKNAKDSKKPGPKPGAKKNKIAAAAAPTQPSTGGYAPQAHWDDQNKLGVLNSTLNTLSTLASSSHASDNVEMVIGGVVMKIAAIIERIEPNKVAAASDTTVSTVSDEAIEAAPVKDVIVTKPLKAPPSPTASVQAQAPFVPPAAQQAASA